MTNRPRLLDAHGEVVNNPPGQPLATHSRPQPEGPSGPVIFKEDSAQPDLLPEASKLAVSSATNALPGTAFLVLFGLSGLLASWVVFSLAGFMLAQFQLSLVLGGLTGTGLVASLGLLVWAAIREWRAWRALAEVDRLRQVLSANLARRDAVAEAGLAWIDLVSTHLPDTPSIKSAIREAESAAEVRALLRSRVAAPLSAQAADLGQRAAIECAGLIAVCPHKSGDGLIVGLRGLNLIRQVSMIYGLRPGLTVTAAIVRNLAWTAMGTAGAIVFGETLTDWAVTEAPVVKHLAGAVGAGAFEVFRIIRLARFTARACCPLDPL